MIFEFMIPHSTLIVKENCFPLAICGGVWYNVINQSC